MLHSLQVFNINLKKDFMSIHISKSLEEIIADLAKVKLLLKELVQELKHPQDCCLSDELDRE